MTSCSAPEDTTVEHRSVALLRAAVDALVARPAQPSAVTELTELIAGVTLQLGRLDGWLRAAEGELSIRTGGQLPTDDGPPRSLAGWLAELRRDSPAAAGRRLRTAELLRQLPQVADAVLNGLLTPAQAQVLTRLVGSIDPAALLPAQNSIRRIAAGLESSRCGSGWPTSSPPTSNPPCKPSRTADTTGGSCRPADSPAAACTAGSDCPARTAKRPSPPSNPSPAAPT